MPYLALARKYRPQRFEDIVGQEHVSETLQKAIASNRVHHAYLFTGIRGVGKTTAARVLAKALNCESGPTAEPCNECVACKEITAGRSMDVMELDAASNRGIDDMRELREGVRYTTARDRFKIVIIDEVHMLTEAAFNALLKTLEEPPPHVRFVLATTDPQKMPATILSRCQRFDFRRVTAASLVAHLERICTAEGIAVDAAALAIIVRQTQGSVRDAMSLLDQLLAASSDGQLTAARTMEVLGVADRKWVLKTIAALLEQDARSALTTLREVFITGYDISLFITEVLEALRNAMVLALAGENRELVDLSQFELEELAAIIADRNPYDLHHYLRVMLDAVEQIRKSEFPMFAAEEALVRVASAGQMVQIPRLVQRLAELEARLNSRGADSQALFKEPQKAPKEPEKGPSSPSLSGAEEEPPTPVAPPVAPPQAPSPPSDDPAPPLMEAVDEALDDAPGATDAFALTPGEAPPESDPDVPASPPAPTGPALPGLSGRPKNTRPVDLELLAAMPEEPPVDESPPHGPGLHAAPPAGEGGGELPGAFVPEPSAAPPYPDLSRADLGEVWVAFLATMTAHDMGRLAEFDTRVLEACVVTSANNDALTLTYPAGSWATLAPLALEERLPAFLALPVSVILQESQEEMLDNSLEADRQRRRDARRTELDGRLRDHPHVKAALSLFGGSVHSVDVDADVLED